jgi:hypothetical protein
VKVFRPSLSRTLQVHEPDVAIKKLGQPEGVSVALRSLNTIPEFQKLYHCCETVKVTEFHSTIFHLRGDEMSLISMILMLATQMPQMSLELLLLLGTAVSQTITSSIPSNCSLANHSSTQSYCVYSIVSISIFLAAFQFSVPQTS